MNSFIQFDPVFPLPWTMIAFVLLVVALLWLEISKDHRFPIFRVLALLVMLFSLLVIAIRPSYSKMATQQSVMLLTSGFNPATADSLLKKYPQVETWRAPDAAAYREVEEIGSYRDLLKKGKLAFVLGDGLPLHAIDLMEDAQFQFFPGEKTSGIMTLKSESYTSGRTSFVRGSIDGKKDSRVLLKGPGGVEDSVILVNDGLSEFALQFRPKEPGLFLYSLQYEGATGTMTEEVPVEVLAQRKLSVLMLQRYPDAETKFLKNFLASKGNTIVMRTQVSKSNFRYEYSNHAETKLSRITQGAIAEFDILLTDEETLDLLSSDERTALGKSVEKGMGLLLIFRQRTSKEKIVTGTIPLKLERDAPDTVKFLVPGFGYFTQPFLPLAVDANVVVPGIKSDKRILTGYGMLGYGKIAFQLIQETYRLSMSGNQEAYAELWSSLLESVARKEEKKFSLVRSPTFPVHENEPFQMEIISSGDTPALSLDSVHVPLAEDVVVDGVWHGKAWAGKPGWHTLTMNGSKTNFFVSADGAWNSLSLSNQRLVNESRSTDSEPTLKEISIQTPVSQLIFLILFLISAGFLWLAPKI